MAANMNNEQHHPQDDQWRYVFRIKLGHNGGRFLHRFIHSLIDIQTEPNLTVTEEHIRTLAINADSGPSAETFKPAYTVVRFVLDSCEMSDAEILEAHGFPIPPSVTSARSPMVTFNEQLYDIQLAEFIDGINF